MKTNLKKLPKSQIEIEFEISAEEFKKHIEHALLHLQEHIKVDGFRPGQAPPKIIEERAGKENILMEAGDLAVKESYSKFVAENKLEPIGEPEVQILKIPARYNASALGEAKGEPAQSPSPARNASPARQPDGSHGGGHSDVGGGNEAGENFVFKVKITVLPEVGLPDYKKITQKIKKKEISVSQEDIEDALNYLRKSRAKFFQLDKPAEEKDFIKIEYESSQINAGKKIEDEFVLGEGGLIPGFEKNLVGMKAGEEKEFSIKLPPASNAERSSAGWENSPRKDLAGHPVGRASPLAGKEVNFKVKMLIVQKVELPEINDEFAKGLGKFDNLDSLKINIKEGITIEKEAQEKQRQRTETLEKIAENSKIEIPEVLINFEKERSFKDFQEKITRDFNISFENYLASIKQDEKTIKESFSKEAEKKVKNFLVLREISKKENILVSQEEVEEEIKKTIKNYSPDVLKKIDIEELKEYTKGAIYNEKVFQKLESYVKN